MNRLLFENVRRILCIGAHVDDIEIGCGGTLLRLLEENPGIEVHWVVATSNPSRKAEAERSAERFLRNAASYQLTVLDFQDGYLPYIGAPVKDAFFEIQKAIEPDVVFTHRLEDRHQDHRMLAELTWNTFRAHPILEYEIPKYEGDLGNPNLFVSLSKEVAERKIELLMDCFETQTAKPWFEAGTFEALLRIRGLEAKAESNMAEAFTARKLVL